MQQSTLRNNPYLLKDFLVPIFGLKSTVEQNFKVIKDTRYQKTTSFGMDVLDSNTKYFLESLGLITLDFIDPDLTASLISTNLLNTATVTPSVSNIAARLAGVHDYLLYRQNLSVRLAKLNVDLERVTDFSDKHVREILKKLVKKNQYLPEDNSFLLNPSDETVVMILGLMVPIMIKKGLGSLLHSGIEEVFGNPLQGEEIDFLTIGRLMINDTPGGDNIQVVFYNTSISSNKNTVTLAEGKQYINRTPCSKEEAYAVLKETDTWEYNSIDYNHDSIADEPTIPEVEETFTFSSPNLNVDPILCPVSADLMMFMSGSFYAKSYDHFYKTLVLSGMIAKAYDWTKRTIVQKIEFLSSALSAVTNHVHATTRQNNLPYCHFIDNVVDEYRATDNLSSWNAEMANKTGLKTTSCSMKLTAELDNPVNGKYCHIVNFTRAAIEHHTFKNLVTYYSRDRNFAVITSKNCEMPLNRILSIVKEFVNVSIYMLKEFKSLPVEDIKKIILKYFPTLDCDAFLKDTNLLKVHQGSPGHAGNNDRMFDVILRNALTFAQPPTAIRADRNHLTFITTDYYIPMLSTL